MLLLALVAISLIKASQCVKAIPGQPVPNSDVLGDLLSKFLGDSYSNNALFDFILGQPSQNRDNLTGDNLDISILDVNNVRKIIAFAKKKHVDKIMPAENSRRREKTNGEYVNEYVNGEYDFFPKNETVLWRDYIINKSLDLMDNCMYMTKEKINLTRPFRKRYMGEVGYQIAILYGASEMILNKMESLYSKMLKLHKYTSFIWFLILYEKLLTCNIDIDDAVEKIFIVQDAFAQVRGAKDEMNSIQKQGYASRDQIKEMMMHPNASTRYKEALKEHEKRFQTK